MSFVININSKIGSAEENTECVVSDSRHGALDTQEKMAIQT